MEKENIVDKKDDSDIKKKIAELTGKMAHKTLAIWATDCAEHVLSHFEQKYPKDNRPRNAVAAGRAWVRGELSVREARSAAFAAHAAARDADEGMARAVARAAGHPNTCSTWKVVTGVELHYTLCKAGGRSSDCRRRSKDMGRHISKHHS